MENIENKNKNIVEESVAEVFDPSENGNPLDQLSQLICTFTGDDRDIKELTLLINV